MDFYGFAGPHEDFSVVKSWGVLFFTHLLFATLHLLHAIRIETLSFYFGQLYWQYLGQEFDNISEQHQCRYISNICIYYHVYAYYNGISKLYM
jgi:hypothetical protein